MKKLLVLAIFFFLFINNVYSLSLNTESIVAMDIKSKRIFYEKDKDNIRLPASTTKIMTALLAVESGRLEEIVTAKEEVLTIYGSNIYVEYGEKILLLDLVYGLMLRSGNDAAVVIASFIAGSEEKFVKMMNDKANDLGMSNTIFNNPHGLDDDTKNYTTVYDLALLYSYAYQNSKFREIVSTKTYKTTSERKAYSWTNRADIVLYYDKNTGAKTGYTPVAGKGLVSSSSDINLDIVIASFSNIYDYELHTAISEEIFNNYENTLLLDNSNINFLNSPYKEDLYIKESFYYPITKNEENKIIKKVEFFDKKNLKDNDMVGEVLFFLEDEIIGKRELYIKLQKESIWSSVKSFFSNILAKLS